VKRADKCAGAGKTKPCNLRQVKANGGPAKTNAPLYAVDGMPTLHEFLGETQLLGSFWKMQNINLKYNSLLGNEGSEGDETVPQGRDAVWQVWALHGDDRKFVGLLLRPK